MSRLRIKICGVTRKDDALAAAIAGADAVGLVFYPGSPRNVSLQSARDIASALPPFVTLTGLFVNAAPEEIEAVLSEVPIGLLQFHGDEPPQACGGFGKPWVKAVQMRPGFDLVEYARRYRHAGAAALVLDTPSASFGGSGQCFDWSMIPAQLPLPWILAGGLDEMNVAQALACVRPWAVDVSSGVETPGGPKGIKDPQRITRFVSAALAAQNLTESTHVFESQP